MVPEASRASVPGQLDSRRSYPYGREGTSRSGRGLSQRQAPPSEGTPLRGVVALDALPPGAPTYRPPTGETPPARLCRIL